MKEYFYPRTITSVVIALSNMFKGFKIQRLDTNGDLVKEFEVPFTFGPVNKYQYLRTREEENKEYYLQLPRISLVLNGINYAPDRATGVNETRHFYDKTIGIDNLDDFYEDMMPTPYDLEFEVAVRTEALDDFSQLMENILPYFNPSQFLRVKEFSFLTIERDLLVLLNSVSPEFTMDQEENEKREVNANISVTVKAWLYQPISSAKIIKIINTKYFVSNNITSEWGTTSASSILAESYNTSGVIDVSAAPVSGSYDTSGTFQTIVDGQSATGYYYTSASNYTLSAGEQP